VQAAAAPTKGRELATHPLANVVVSPDGSSMIVLSGVDRPNAMAMARVRKLWEADVYVIHRIPD
jgi:hypothetical protein